MNIGCVRQQLSLLRSECGWSDYEQSEHCETALGSGGMKPVPMDVEFGDAAFLILGT